MALADTAQLLVELNLGGNFTSGIGTAESRLSTFSANAGRHFGAVGRAVDGMGTALGHAGNRIKGLVTGPLGMLGMAGGVAGVGVALEKTVTSAVSFQRSMELLRSQTGATQAEVDSMSKSVLDLSTHLSQGPEELAAGLYHIESAGFRGAKALDILQIASKGAAAGGADLESVTNAIVGAEQSGVRGAENLGMAMGTLNGIVGSGNMRMQDLADAMGSGILATAKTFGASMQSVGAALATMTDEGIPAVDAATRLRMSMNLLGAPTTKAGKLFKQIGLDHAALANAMRGPGGLIDTIGLLHEKMVKAKMIDESGNINTAGAQFLSGAFGGGRSSSAIMTLVGNYNLLLQKQEAVNKGAASFGDAVSATEQTTAYKWGQFVSTLQATGIKVGNAILPDLTNAMQSIGDWVSKNQGNIVDFVKGTADAIHTAASALGTAAGILKGAWDAIPGPLRDALLGGFVVNKASDWLFGVSPMSVGKNLLGGLLGGRGGAVGKIAGAMSGTPVFVTNWPSGFGGGGGLGGLLGGAATGEGLLASLGLTTATLIPLAAGVAVAAAAAGIMDQIIRDKGGKFLDIYNPNPNIPSPVPVQVDPSVGGPQFYGGKGFSHVIVPTRTTPTTSGGAFPGKAADDAYLKAAVAMREAADHLRDERIPESLDSGARDAAYNLGRIGYKYGGKAADDAVVEAQDRSYDAIEKLRSATTAGTSGITAGVERMNRNILTAAAKTPVVNVTVNVDGKRFVSTVATAKTWESAQTVNKKSAAAEFA